MFLPSFYTLTCHTIRHYWSQLNAHLEKRRQRLQQQRRQTRSSVLLDPEDGGSLMEQLRQRVGFRPGYPTY